MSNGVVSPMEAQVGVVQTLSGEKASGLTVSTETSGTGVVDMSKLQLTFKNNVSKYLMVREQNYKIPQCPLIGTKMKVVPLCSSQRFTLIVGTLRQSF